MKLNPTTQAACMTGAYGYGSRRRKCVPAMSRIPWEKFLSFTPTDLTKLLISAVIIVVANKIQLFNDRLSALVIALPITSVIAMIWMQRDGQATERLANHAEATFWFVVPTLPMFLILPCLLRHGWGFWTALIANCLLTIAAFWLIVWVLRRCGINLIQD